MCKSSSEIEICNLKTKKNENNPDEVKKNVFNNLGFPTIFCMYLQWQNDIKVNFIYC